MSQRAGDRTFAAAPPGCAEPDLVNGFCYGCTCQWPPDQWAFEHGVELRLILSGKPTQNGFIDSFNGRFRDQWLNEHWFSDISHARRTISEWRQDYNECRPHSTLNYQTPPEFAAGRRKGNSENEGSDITN